MEKSIIMYRVLRLFMLTCPYCGLSTLLITKIVDGKFVGYRYSIVNISYCL